MVISLKSYTKSELIPTNSSIDPVDIGIAIATDNEAETRNKATSKNKRKANRGCLTTILTFLCGIGLLALAVAMI
jgi:hypothetical protein